MNYSQDSLNQIESLASMYMPISDMAVVLEIPADILRSDVADKSHPASIAYRRGKIASKVKLHKQEMTLAMLGSPQALANARENLIDMEEDE